MDPWEYVDARWSALVRAAMLLGASEADAPAVVQRVLDTNRRRIRRAADPDPIVHRALTRAIPGGEQTLFGAEPDIEARREMLIDSDEPPPAATAARRRRPRRRWPFVAAVGAALVATGVALSPSGSQTPLTDRLRADQVPSLFGYDEGAAQVLLESRGLTVTIRPFRSWRCWVGWSRATRPRAPRTTAATRSPSTPRCRPT